jgi:signal transduction histidine kinase
MPAVRVTVRLRRVCDDGPGMQRERAEDGMSQGLDAMRERTAALGGTIEWLSPDGGGTVVRLLVPPLTDTGADVDDDELAA